MNKFIRSKALLLNFCVLLMIAGCLPAPNMRFESAQLLDIETNVIGINDRQQRAVGYILLKARSDQDFGKIAADHGATLHVDVFACSDNAMLDGWPYLFQLEPSVYAVLLAYRSSTEVQYNLADHPEQICARVSFGGTMNPAHFVRSSVLEYTIEPEVYQAIRKYDRTNGEVRIR